MLQHIISFSVSNKLIIGLLTLGLILYGGYETSRLPIDAVPDITDNQVQVITISPSLGAPDVERLITYPIEQANSNIPGLKEIRSFSRFGLSLVTIVFNDDVDVYWARQQVSERLLQVSSQIPDKLGVPELAPVTSGLGEIYQYVVRTLPGYEGKYSLTELRTIQDWIVRRQLLGTPGVADVSSFGGNLKQYEVTVTNEKLSAYDLTLQDVFTALENNNSNAGGAYIEKGPGVLFIRSEGVAQSPEDIEKMVVRVLSNGIPLLIRDVANVSTGAATRFGAMCYNDKGEVAGAVVMMLKGANSSQVIEEVKLRIAEIQKTLPEGVVIEAFLDRTKMVDNAIGTVTTNLMEGALIVLFVLVLFLGNLRAGFIVASVIPLAMLFAIIMMNLFGVSGNLMSLGALDFGLIVDGAVIIVEAVIHQMAKLKPHHGAHEMSKGELNDVVNTSASRLMNAAVFGQIIILIVYLPILTLQGIEGKMFKPMAQTVAFALLGAFILSLTYVPMMSSWLLNRKLKAGQNRIDRIMHKLEHGFQKSLKRALEIPKIILSGAVLFFVTSIIIMNFLGGEFIPELEEGDFAVDTRVLTGSNLNTTIASTQKAASLLMERYPEVEKVVTKIGSGEIPTDPMPIEASDMMVILKNKEEWTSAASFDELAEKMSATLTEIPGITAGFQYPVQMRFNELMTGARQDVVCKIFGENLDSLASNASRLGSLISGLNGAKDLYVETISGMPQVVIRHNRDALAVYGLSVEEVNRTIRTAFAGEIAGQIFEDEKRFDLVVKLDPSDRRAVKDIHELLIALPSGAQIPLRTVAAVEVIDGPNQIQREDAKRRIVVGFNVRGRDVESVVNELRTMVGIELELPDGYFITYGGSFENMKAAQNRLSIALPVALVLIFIMLYFAFRSMREGLIIFSAIPFSAIGGVLALAMRGMPFSISAGVGFIALFGVAVLNGIVLISEFNRLRAGEIMDFKTIVLSGTRTRLRPVLMTAAVASLGFFPMAFSNGSGAEVQRPLATVVIGGLITATILTLYVIPILYVLFEKKKKISLHTGIVVLPLIMILLFGQTDTLAQADQTYFTLEEALDLGLKKSEKLKAAQWAIEGVKMEQKTVYGLENTSIGFESGQFNTSARDNKFSAQQSFKWPGYYKARKERLQTSQSIASTEFNLTELELKLKITQLFYDWQFYVGMKYLAQRSDSLYALAVDYLEVMERTGESEALALSMIKLQKIMADQELSSIQASLQSLRIEFEFYCGLDSTRTPISMEMMIFPDLPLDTLDWSHHPYLKSIDLQLQIEKNNLSIKKAEALPDFTLGYNNMSIKGIENINGRDVYHDGSDRFQWMGVGIQLPLFSCTGRKLEAQRMLINQKEAEQRFQYEMFSRDFQQALQNYLRLKTIAAQSGTEIIKESDKMIQIAESKRKAGEMEGVQWVHAVNQALTARRQALQNIRNYNDAAIILQSFIQTK